MSLFNALSVKSRVLVGALSLAVLSAGFAPGMAEAKRLGGGGSIGKTAPSYSRQATPQTPPSSPAAAPTAPAKATPGQTAPNPAAAQPARNRFLGPIMGLAAGLGLAALFSHLGLGDELASFMGTVLIVILAVVAIRFLLSKMRGQQPVRRPQPAYSAAGSSPYDGFQGDSTRIDESRPMAREALRDNDFGKRDVRSAFDDVQPVGTQQGMVKELPVGFDEAGFVNRAKQFFVTMQGLFDKGDVQALREYCTDHVVDHLTMDIQSRNGAANVTEVVMVNAELLGFETDVDEQLATVAITAMVRETVGGPAEEIREMWVLSRPVSGQGGWLLAGIHSL